ncbi:hypothetical protein KSZ_43730 [Dictyobacter formicarum]|uniref:Secreted protein n=1 Tax=Dictyobacter formicarum TaxID=2778368 RepID=A0ABQ3VJI1_9CHLR|nr:hypothetical protein KSZ_43730 [Dictyobacter formicarum]
MCFATFALLSTPYFMKGKDAYGFWQTEKLAARLSAPCAVDAVLFRDRLCIVDCIYVKIGCLSTQSISPCG